MGRWVDWWGGKQHKKWHTRTHVPGGCTILKKQKSDVSVQNSVLVVIFPSKTPGGGLTATSPQNKTRMIRTIWIFSPRSSSKAAPYSPPRIGTALFHICQKEEPFEPALGHVGLDDPVDDPWKGVHRMDQHLQQGYRWAGGRASGRVVGGRNGETKAKIYIPSKKKNIYIYINKNYCYCSLGG